MIKFNARKLAAVALAQSTEAARRHICGVFFEGNIVVATNGHMLTAAHDPDAEISSNGIYPVSRKAIMALKNTKSAYAVIEYGVLTVFDKLGTIRYTSSSTKIDGTFPDWRRTIPKDRDAPCNAGFSHIMHKKLCETAKITGADSYQLFGCTATSGAYSVGYHDVEDVYSVAMAMGGKYANSHPSWLTSDRTAS